MAEETVGGALGTGDGENIRSNVALRLGAWWEANARDLPWRFGRATPWGVLVSEVMSQQTQMSRVVPYWVDWMARWPDARALAAAPKAEVITAWGRLGYPRRALRLKECARVVSEDHADELPRTYDELTALPGIGDYTASAVLSFAYGERVAVIDTNIRRVLSRVFTGTESLGGAASPAERALAKRMLPRDRTSGLPQAGFPQSGLSQSGFPQSGFPQSGFPQSGFPQSGRSADCAGNTDVDAGDHGVGGHGDGDHSAGRGPDFGASRPSVVWNQSVMELGALICTAKSPMCQVCPIAGDCAFLQAGRPGLGERRTRPRQRFQGTDRQVRGLVLAALRDLPEHTVLDRADAERLWTDHIQLDACIASLDDDGLVEMTSDGSLRLPR
jgi:A/G-specific adenine glycosylase